MKTEITEGNRLCAEKEIWQYRNVFSDEWATDNVAMNNPKFKSFSDYERHTRQLNNKFKSNCECRCIPTQP